MWSMDEKVIALGSKNWKIFESSSASSSSSPAFSANKMTSFGPKLGMKGFYSLLGPV